MTLALQVKTRNLVNSRAMLIAEQLENLLAKHAGKRIVKFTPYKTWAASIKKEIDALQDSLLGENFRLVFGFFHSSIIAEIDTTFPVSDYGVSYVKQSLYVASFDPDNGFLREVRSSEKVSFRIDYTEQEIQEKRQKINELEELCHILKSEIREFN